MDTKKISHGTVSMIAHRGASGIERENTNAAFVAAGNRSYFGIETDVHKTIDGEFVIIHDDDTNRVTNGKSHLEVEKERYEVLKQLRFSDLDGNIRSDLGIPKLEEYIRICKKYEKTCVLELKNRFEKADISKIIEIIQTEGYLDKVIFISFSLENCINLRELLPEQKIQWLLEEEIGDEIIETLCRYHLDLDSIYTRLNKALIERLHEHRIQVNCWTCDNEKDAEKLVKMGVDFITSNILE